MVMSKNIQTSKSDKKNLTAAMERRRESVRPRQRWREKVEEDLNITGLKKTSGQWPETVRDARRPQGLPRSTKGK